MEQEQLARFSLADLDHAIQIIAAQKFSAVERLRNEKDIGLQLKRILFADSKLATVRAEKQARQSLAETNI